MRLLNAKTLKLEEFTRGIPKYGILSHRWEQEEITYQDVESDHSMTLRGWPKVISCCRIAISRGLRYVWIDTCCIDKRSSAELIESINSMYLWYAQAEECYAFLSDVDSQSLHFDFGSDEFMSSAWFTRGWTLQELIAPANVLFYNKRWDLLGSKAQNSGLLHSITRIDTDVLCGKAKLTRYSIAQRMSWAAGRVTTRLEDEAYCLLGIFKVNMPMLYGEGQNAFRRLQEEIIKQSDDQTLFAWHDELLEKPVLAPSPSCFADLHNLECIYPTNDLRFGHSLSNSGLTIKLMLIPWTMNTYVALLSCGRVLAKSPDAPKKSTRGYDRLGIFLRQTQFPNHLVRVSLYGQDTVMLNSDIVASKRDEMAIKDRQVFVRQSIIDMPPVLSYAFSCSFKHRSMFMYGGKPFGADVQHASVLDVGKEFLLKLGDYEHVAAGCFHVSGLGRPPLRNLFLYLGFDLDFAPVCLITNRKPDSVNLVLTNNASSMEGRQTIHSSSTTEHVSLAWLLSEIAAGESSDTILAFRGHPNASTEVHCRKLVLKISFEIRPSIVLNQQVWHVLFDELPNHSPNSAANILRPASTISDTGGKSPFKKQLKFVMRAWSKVMKTIFQVPRRTESSPSRWGNSTYAAPREISRPFLQYKLTKLRLGTS